MSDGLLSLPYRYPLLREMPRVDAAVMSAVLYCARLNPPGAWCYLSDAKIFEWTGYRRTAVHAARQRLLSDGWIECDRGYSGRNAYRIPAAAQERLAKLEGLTQDERRARLRRSAERAVASMGLVEAVASILIEFVTHTGRMPARKTLQRWVAAAARLHASGVSACAIPDIARPDDRSPYALLRRIGHIEKPPNAPHFSEYEIQEDPELGFVAVKM